MPLTTLTIRYCAPSGLAHLFTTQATHKQDCLIDGLCSEKYSADALLTCNMHTTASWLC